MLAAGASTRMRGVDKLTKPLRGQPLLRDRVMMLTQSQVSRVLVVVPTEAPARREALAGLDVQTVLNADAASGMASSIKAGIRAVPPDCDAALIMPADMPDIEATDIDALCAAFIKNPGQILRAAAGETPGSPVIFPRAHFKDLLRLDGDQSGRAVLKTASNVILHPLKGDRATFDLDTPEAWALWHQRQN